MKCPYCGCTDQKVIDSRPHGDKIRRRRECESCHKRFTTYEVIEMPILMVRKKDNTFETFSRDKLIHGILSAIKKRPVSMEQISSIADDVEKLCSNGPKNEITTSQIGDLVLERLKDIDEVAYIRFASVYKDFKDVEGFISEIRELGQK